MLPSLGSTSRPAEVPHFLPAGSSPQLRVTLGAGFGNPSPVIGLATLVCADSVAPENVARESTLTNAIVRAIAPAPSVSRIRVDIGPPLRLQNSTSAIGSQLSAIGFRARG